MTTSDLYQLEQQLFDLQTRVSALLAEVTALASQPAAPPEPLLLSVKEAAAMLGISPATLYRWIDQAEGTIPVVRPGTTIKIPRHWVESFKDAA